MYLGKLDNTGFRCRRVSHPGYTQAAAQSVDKADPNPFPLTATSAVNHMQAPDLQQFMPSLLWAGSENACVKPQMPAQSAGHMVWKV